MVKIRLQGTTNEIKRMRRVIERNRSFVDFYERYCVEIKRIQSPFSYRTIDGIRANSGCPFYRITVFVNPRNLQAILMNKQ